MYSPTHCTYFCTGLGLYTNDFSAVKFDSYEVNLINVIFSRGVHCQYMYLWKFIIQHIPEIIIIA